MAGRKHLPRTQVRPRSRFTGNPARPPDLAVGTPEGGHGAGGIESATAFSTSSSRPYGPDRAAKQPATRASRSAPARSRRQARREGGATTHRPRKTRKTVRLRPTPRPSPKRAARSPSSPRHGHPKGYTTPVRAASSTESGSFQPRGSSPARRGVGTSLPEPRRAQLMAQAPYRSAALDGKTRPPPACSCVGRTPVMPAAPAVGTGESSRTKQEPRLPAREAAAPYASQPRVASGTYSSTPARSHAARPGLTMTRACPATAVILHLDR